MPPDELAERGAVAAAEPDPSAPRMAPLDTLHFADVSDSTEIIGAVQVIFTRYENTFVAIAREYGLGNDALRRANPSVDHWLPGEGTPVYLPTSSILPQVPREGIVVNLPSMRLYYFERDGDDADRASITTYPIGIGREGWATPLGEAKVTDKIVDPTWYPPASVRQDHAERGDPLPPVVPPGPDNPLGRHAMVLSLPGYLIHGTNRPAGVGLRVSAGCIRLYPEHIEALFERVPRGTPVRIVNEPVLAGWHDGELYLEAHAPLEEDGRDLAEAAADAIAKALERAGRPDYEIDAEAVAAIVAEQRGIPLPIGRESPSPVEYLATARIVENTVEMQSAETAAALDL
ncbi:MAG TPA: L,D-transpeptidase family protein [Gammaproteobacteria bacterium]